MFRNNFFAFVLFQERFYAKAAGQDTHPAGANYFS